ncbi:Acetyltransferase, GNAT family [Lactobacillus pasteurii DSM 23907 = CRBIP 24.76]|uniref:Acetyltransferase, GNAT family n=1 Tax=Lactobacillus pasteurii DSM 23907 = CRBIP 24.76 TaxID=1423790 RepID=I7J0E9_9LACO|nr:Acetyltransferase, GNAT family [Lactobacillus pasteurii DSM 23907 = CRBIP 24.76]
MEIKELTNLDESTTQTLLTIWENSVRATHKFLSEEEILEIRQFVPQAFAGVEHLFVIIDDQKSRALWALMSAKSRCCLLMRLHVARAMAASF